MEDGAAREDACREYQSSLEDLTFNSKPHINMLTILAEENIGFAKDIVAIIEAQISKAPSAEKLPVLYLVDSIVKNVGGEFLAVFAKNLITSFICVFEKVDENTRKSLFKLRSTWEEVFPLKKLYALDVRVNSLDPAWPIKPLPPTVNASIHVNPKFLKQSDEATPAADATPPSPTSSSPTSLSPAPPSPSPPSPTAPAPPAVSQSSLTQEQLIRQQLLAKQKQLLELQQKKIELELEQTKAQLAGGFVLPTVTAISTPVTSAPLASVPLAGTPLAGAPPKPVSQTAPAAVRPWIPPQTQAETKPSTRDPRLNRPSVPAGSQPKDSSAGRRENPAGVGGGNQGAVPERRPPEKPPRTDRPRLPRKDAAEDKSKSPSPMAKHLPSKSRAPEAEAPRAAAEVKKDPRLKKRPQDKPADDEQEKKKRCGGGGDKKEREEAALPPPRSAEPPRPPKSKLVNGAVTKHERDGEAADKADFKSGGNARTHARKRTRSRSRSRSPAASPKRKERRSPKSRPRSSSLSPSPSRKAGKGRRPRPDEPPHGKPGREDRPNAKKNQPESRRSKRPADDRHAESRESPRGHDAAKEAKEAPHRWRSGWEDNKHAKLSEEPHAKPGAPRHKPYGGGGGGGGPARPATPRTPKHRLSVDANLQIPEALNSASKKDLLRRASKRLESGEISQEDFLNMAHQIKHFFQYQEEKQQRSEGWEAPGDLRKQPLLATPAAQLRPPDAMGPAELSYYEHKSKLRKTQVNRRPPGEEWEDADSPDEGEAAAAAAKSEKTGRGAAAHRYGRAPRDRPGDRRSKEREEPRAPLAPMVEEYNHGKEFPALKSLPGLRFRRRVDPREPSEREWTSPLTERQHYDERDEHKSGYDAPRRYDSRHPDPRRPDGPPPSGTVVRRNSPGLEAPPPRFERERLSPLHGKDGADASPAPRFESPTSEHSDDGPLEPRPPSKALLKGPHGDSPGHTPPREAGHAPGRYGDPGHLGPSRPHPGVWFEAGGHGGRYDEPPFDGPLLPGPGRFDGAGPPHHTLPERLEARGDVMGRFEGLKHQGPGRYGGPGGQQPPGRYESQGSGPSHLEGPMQRFDAPRHFNSLGPGGSGPLGFQQGPLRFEGPSSQMRFEGPGQSGPRYDLQGGPPRFEYTHGQGQGPPRFAPQHGLQASMRPLAPPLYDGPMAPQQSFPVGSQRFAEPLNPQFPGGPLAFPAQQAGGFNLQVAPAFAQAPQGGFYSAAGAPSVGMQQPVSMMGAMNQPFLPQSAAPFGQTPQVVPPENQFRQVDVNDLLSKLISNGIIKPTQPDAAATAAPPLAGSESSAAAAAAAQPAEEEEEEEQEAEEEDDVPDLTGFSIDDMKQRYENVVTKLYSGNQCCLCSMRFTAAQTDMYADHLDWHFRQNHAGKVASKKVTHRRWYYSLTDWIEFEEIADLEERAKSQFFEKENEEEVQKSQAAAKEKEFQSVRAAKDQVGELCEICQEPFETYWVEEEEDWFLKNAIRVDDKNFHPSCFEDYKNTSSYLDVTPSPNKLLTDHPLGALVKMEDEAEGRASCAVDAAVTVKQEEECEPAAPPEAKDEEGKEAAVTDAVKEEEAS